MWIFRSARSMNTTKAITATIITITPMIAGAEMAPIRPCSKNWASAPGTSAMMPTKMMSEMPLPTPRAVICSPSHIRNIVPPTSVMTQASLEEEPRIMGEIARLEAPREAIGLEGGEKDTVP